MKIAIEGMDGVGKTTIAKRFAAENGFIYLDKPLNELFDSTISRSAEFLPEIYSKIYDFDDESIKAWFFGLGNIYSFVKYKNEDLIVDRHFASNYFWNGTEKTNEVFKCMLDLIGVPDLTILLYASVETRLRRLYKRNPGDYDLRDTDKHVLGYDKMEKFLIDFNIPYVLIDTERKNEDEVYDEVCCAILDYKAKLYSRNLAKK